MPPPMPNPTKRMTANPAKPVARYRPGKVTQQDDSSDEDDEEENEEVQVQQQRRSGVKAAQPRSRAPVRQDVQEDDDDEEGFETDDEEDGEGSALSMPAQPTAVDHLHSSTLPLPTQAQISVDPKTKSESEEDDSEEEESSEEESSSEEEEPRRKFQRPTFVKKSERNPGADVQSTSDARNSATPAAPQTSTADNDEQLRRRTQAELLIQDKLERDAIARAAGKKSWDDDDDLLPEQLVDDTDGQDPEAEHQAWKLRELKRLKRDREAIEIREREIEELERRRNLTAAERDREDEEFIAKQRAETEESRSKANYMSRYHHKGAFFQDDENAELLKKRDIMGARFADEVQDKSVLPEYMRVRDMTKLGKKGRTRYTDLKGQDTGRFGDDVKRWRGAGDQGQRDSAFNAENVDERFRPDSDRRRVDYADDHGKRPEYRRRSRSRSPRRERRGEDRGEGVDSYRPRRSQYSRSRSRSGSPPRRKRSPSPFRDRDKRRKLEI